MQFNRYKITVCCAVGMICLMVAGSFLLKMHRSEQNKTIDTLNIKYSFSLLNNSPVAVKNAGLSASTPLPASIMHNCPEARVNHPFHAVRDKVGNTFLELHWDVIPPFTTKVITISSQVEMRKTPQKFKSDSLGRYLDAEPFIESDHKRIKEIALRLAEKRELETIRNVFNWVSDHVQYSGYVKKNRGALYALKHRKGDCTEFATLFVALCRANRIPARYMGGFIASKSAILDLGDYHNWAEFFHEGRWHLADPQNNIFMNDAEAATYIAFKIIQPSLGDNGALLSRIKGNRLKIITNR